MKFHNLLCVASVISEVLAFTASAGDSTKASLLQHALRAVLCRGADSSCVALQIEGSAKGGSIHLSDSQTKIDIEAAVATAYASALAAAQKHHGETSCVAWVSTEGCIYTEDGAQCFECKAHAVSYGAVQEINAISRARAHPPLCLMLF